MIRFIMKFTTQLFIVAISFSALSISQASTLSYEGEISSANAYDTYVVNSTAGDVMVFDILANETTSRFTYSDFDSDNRWDRLDTYLTLYSDDGYRIAFNDDDNLTNDTNGSVSNVDSYLQYTADYDGFYIILVAAYPSSPNELSGVFGLTDSGSIGYNNYKLDISGVSPVPVPAALWLFGSGLLGLIGMARRKV